MWATFLVGLLCVSCLPCLYGQSVQQGPHMQRSCDLQSGVVCIPTACSATTCPLFKKAVCVNDRCGCEARFFNWMAGEKTYQDVSKMCSSASGVINFLNYTAASDTFQNDQMEDSTTALKFFREFNLLVTEILTDITDYLKMVSRTSPTAANIEKLKQAVRTLSALKRSHRIEYDEIAGKINWGKVLKTGVKIISKLAKSRGTSSSNVEDLEQRVDFGKIVKGGLGVLGGIFGDSQVVASDVQDVDPRFWGTLLKTGVKLLSGLAKDPEASSDVEDVQERINWLKIAKTAGKVIGGLLGDYSVLQDVLSDEGSYADAVASGKVAVSDKDTRKALSNVLASLRKVEA